MRAGCPRLSRSAWRRSGPVDEHRSPDSAEEDDDTQKACGPQVDGTANADGTANTDDIAHDEGLAHHIAHGVAQCINVEDIDDGDYDYDDCTGGREPTNPEPRRGAGAGASRGAGTQVPPR